jgi:arylsulfatase A-like enzyme
MNHTSLGPLASLLLALVPAACGGEPADLPTSVIVVSIDTLRADRVGTYGYERDTTPFLDRFAEESIVFERALTSAPFTLPSHMTMLTGLHPAQHGVMGEGKELAGGFPILAERLSENGYQTGGFYYQAWIDRRFGFHRGFDVFRNHMNAEGAQRHLAEWVGDLDPERPFFLFVHLFDVHCGTLEDGQELIYDPPAPFDRMFLEDAPDRFAGMSAKQCWEKDRLLDEPRLEALRAMYDGGIRYVDTKLEYWFGEFEKRGLLDNTLVIVTSDHGEGLGLRNGVVKGHGGVYQDGLHVPLIVRTPDGSRAGERVSQTVGLVDIVPTVLHAADLPYDPRLPGASLLDDLPGDRVFHARFAKLDVLVQWPWKVVRREGEAWAFNLEEDPDEKAGRPGEEGLAVNERVQGAFIEQLGPDPVILRAKVARGPSEEELQKLRDLGYTGDE